MFKKNINTIRNNINLNIINIQLRISMYDYNFFLVFRDRREKLGEEEMEKRREGKKFGEWP